MTTSAINRETTLARERAVLPEVLPPLQTTTVGGVSLIEVVKQVVPGLLVRFLACERLQTSRHHAVDDRLVAVGGAGAECRH